MAHDPDNFLAALIAWIGQRADLAYAGSPRKLWRHRAVETDAAMERDGSDRPAAYTVLSLGQPPPQPPVGPATASVQSVTLGFDAAAAWAQAASVYNALLREDGRPVRNIGPGSTPPLAGFRLLGVVRLRGPWRGAVDGQGRVPVLIAFDAPHVAVA